jgi:hypothetical protein
LDGVILVYIAKLVTVAKFKNITDKLKPFVHYHSNLENIEVSDDDQIAILQIENTESYFPIFLKNKPSIEDIEEKLAKQESRLNADARKLILHYLSEDD